LPVSIVYLILRLGETNEGGNLMRFIVIVAVAAILAPAALSATVAPASALEATDLSAAKKKKKPAKPKEEYLKAAPGTGPSGPQTKY
jgi:hypothetical protein